MKSSKFLLAGILNIYLAIQLPAAQMKINAQQTVSQEEQHAWEEVKRKIENRNAYCSVERIKDVKTLLQQYPKFINFQDEDGMTSLMYAAIYLDLEMVDVLLTQSSSLNLKDKKGMTALMYAAANGYTKEIVQTLIDLGANINLKDARGRTALHRAATFAALPIVETLIAHEAELNLQDEDGITPLMYSVSGSYRDVWARTEIVEALIVAGANLNLQDKDGNTALINSVCRGLTQPMQALCVAGANLDLQDTEGRTALRCAAVRCQLETIQILIAAGADIHIKDENGYTVAREARKDHAIEKTIKQGLAERQQRLETLQKIKQAVLDNTDLAQDPTSIIAEYVGIRENTDTQSRDSSTNNNDRNTKHYK